MFKRLVFILPLTASLTSCVTTKNEPITVSYKLPVVKKISTTGSSIKSNDIRINIEPMHYSPKRSLKKSYEQNDYAKYGVNLLTSGRKEYKVIAVPAYTPDPSSLGFKLKITNQMSHILRLDGAVVAFRSDKNAIATESQKYSEFKQAIILPGEEKEINLYGPSLASIADGENITLALYDVTSKTNSAGNPVKKSSFKWTYNIKFEEHSKNDNINIYGERMHEWEYLSKKSNNYGAY